MSDRDCPFCGGEARRSPNPVYGDDSMVACKQCGASAFHLKWNRRASDPLLDEVEALREALEKIAAIGCQEGTNITRTYEASIARAALGRSKP
jgi:hypothetical protein